MLTQIKTHPWLRALPVVVLTTSRRDEDVLQTYQAGANTFIQKPSEYPRYRDLVKTLHAYWHETALKVPHPLSSSGRRSNCAERHHAVNPSCPDKS